MRMRMRRAILAGTVVATLLAADGLVGSAAVLVQGADLGGGARVGGVAEAGDVLGVSVE
jgi:tetrahydrodipicolinate N-succinyltransferase